MNDTLKIFLRVLPFLIIIIGIAIVIRKGKVKREDLYLQKPCSLKLSFLWWILFLLLIIITEATLYKFGLLIFGGWDDNLVPSIIKVIGIIILAPVAEELVFRGLILYKLKQFKVNRHAAILAQALFFLLLHSVTFDNSINSTIGIIQIFVDAVLYGYAKEHTKSLYTPIAMHATGNFVAIFEQFL